MTTATRPQPADAGTSVQLIEAFARVQQPFKLASREFRPADTEVTVAPGVTVGGTRVVVMAGPWAIESREQMLDLATAARAAGASLLRGGAFTPRTSPYGFHGLNEEGLKYLAEARRETGLPVVTEVVDADTAEAVAEHADVLQIGGCNVQNFPLLRRVATTRKPVLIERGTSTTIQEWLLSAEYVLAGGNPHVILCEAGIRTFETATRATLDLNAVPVVKRLSHLPVVVDPSRGTGHAEYVESMALAALAAGADGLLVDLHRGRVDSLADAAQSLTPGRFARLMGRIRPLAIALGRA